MYTGNLDIPGVIRDFQLVADIPILEIKRQGHL